MNTNHQIRCCSLNVRGIKDNCKRAYIFAWVKKQPYDIFLLQETHSEKSLEHQWESEWGNTIIFNHGINNAAGVMILFSRTDRESITLGTSDDSGRIAHAKLNVNECTYTIINIYAPTKDHTNEPMYISLHIEAHPLATYWR